jgi:hypothetical protein
VAGRLFFRAGSQSGAAWIYQTDGTVSRQMKVNVVPPVFRK